MSKSNTSPKFNRGLAALKLNRQMQSDRLRYGIDFIDSYIEDVEGDWLENWGKTEVSTEIGTKETFLQKNADKTPQLIEKVRSFLGKWQTKLPVNLDVTQTIERVIDELARIISSTEADEWLYELEDTLREICLGKSELDLVSITRTRSESEHLEFDEDNEDEDDEWFDMAEELLEEVESIWDISQPE
ncbi:MAG: hypothetical protein AAFO95_12725 [Cyanobacteria bacterium J06600_6]